MAENEEIKKLGWERCSNGTGGGQDPNIFVNKVRVSLFGTLQYVVQHSN